MSFRSQLQGFALGSAIVGAFAMYQLQKDVWSSHRMILNSVRVSDSTTVEALRCVCIGS